MKRHSKTARRLVFSLLLALAVLAPAISMDGLHVARAETSANGQLTKKGAWAAYSFPYAGDLSEVRLSVSYTPADPFTDGAVFLDLYSPTDPPPGGTKIASATAGDREGLKQLLLTSSLDGTYTVIVSNFDFFGRPVQFSINTSDSAGRPGPALTFVSSSEAALPATASPTPTVTAAAPQALATASQQVSGFPTGQLARRGAWAAYSMHYHGDLSEVRIIVVYDPADPFTDGGVFVDLYSPIAPPPGGAKLASAIPGYRSGVQVIPLISDVGGDYTVIVSNWDVLNRPVQFTILTSDSAGDPGPPLTYVSSRS